MFSLLALSYALTRPSTPAPLDAPPSGDLDPAAPPASTLDAPPARAIEASDLSRALASDTSRPRGPSRIIVGGDDDPERDAILAMYAKKRAERDARTHGEPIEISSEDPVNLDVLGPGRWMAQPTEDTARALDDVIDSSPAPRELARQARVRHAHHGARSLASRVASDCVSLHLSILPHTTGRILIDLSLSTQGGLATVEHASLTSIVDLDHPDLRDCLSSGLLGATFPADDLARALDVRVPLFFRDGSTSPTP